jgi:hypothetical protein
MTLPHDPTQFLTHCKAHKADTKSQACKELKIQTNCPPIPLTEFCELYLNYQESDTILQRILKT